VIDVIADDYPQLLQKLDGHTVNIHGVSKKIETKNLQLNFVPADWRYEFLTFITNPNIAYILMLIAIYGLFFELSNPGLVVPGVIGVIALLLVLYAFQLMPINYTGLSLVVFGIACMVFEVFVASFGIIGVGGIIAFIIGSVMLFDIHDANYRLAWSLILVMSAISILFFGIIISLTISSLRKAVVTGKEALIGSDGVVLNVTHEHIAVRVLGEIWEATSNHALKSGDIIKVTNIQGLVLTVEPLRHHKQKKLGD
jgi:membrane-bound serine protease (ClpP class)